MARRCFDIQTTRIAVACCFALTSATIAVLFHATYLSPLLRRLSSPRPGPSGAEEKLRLPADDSPSICLYGLVPLFHLGNATTSFAHAQLGFLRDAALRSFHDAYLVNTASPLAGFPEFIRVAEILVPLRGWESHFASWDDLERFMNVSSQKWSEGSLRRPIPSPSVVLSQPRPGQRTRKFVEESDCEWVVVTRLDADDILAPRYWNFIVEKVIQEKLDPRGHHETQQRQDEASMNSTVLAAVVGSKQLPKVVWGYNRCGGVAAEALRAQVSGYSVGQTRIYRRDIFQGLGYPTNAGNHAFALQRLREKVGRFLQESSTSNATTDEEFLESHVIMIDTAQEGFGAAGIWLQTPLSGHFPWHIILNASTVCTRDRWTRTVAHMLPENGAVVLQENLVPFEYVFESTAFQNISLLDACENNFFFHKVFDGGEMFNGAEESCVALEERWRFYLQQVGEKPGSDETLPAGNLRTRALLESMSAKSKRLVSVN